MSSKDVPKRLSHVLENIDYASAYIDGMDAAALATDRKTLDAVERCLQRITEAVIKIGPEQMAVIAPHISAHAIRGLGNILRHDYDTISPRQIYNTVVERLPELRAACAAELIRLGTK